MTNQQLYFAIGIPMVFSMLNIVAVLVVILQNGRALDSFRRELEARFASLDSRIEKVEGVLQSEMRRVEGVLLVRIDALTERVKALEDETHTRVVR